MRAGAVGTDILPLELTFTLAFQEMGGWDRDMCVFV